MLILRLALMWVCAGWLWLGAPAWGQTAFVRQVKTFDALQALDPRSIHGAVNVLGRDIEDDGWGGLFVWNGYSALTTNTFSVVGSSVVGTGRWTRVMGATVAQYDSGEVLPVGVLGLVDDVLVRGDGVTLGGQPVDLPPDLSLATGTLAVGHGGTGQTTAGAAYAALSPLTTKGDLVIHNGTTPTRFAATGDGQVLTRDSTTATGWKLSAASGSTPDMAGAVGTLAVGHGGTGQTTAGAAYAALSPLTTKGDLVIHNGTTPTRFAATGDGQALVRDSTTATGWKLASLTLADGDWGDFTKTGSAFSLDNGVVEYSNVQAVSTGDRLLGRVTGAGTVEEIVCTVFGRAVLAAASVSAQRTALGLGTAATQNVPASGNASATEVVKGDDTRLTNARTPVAHTHALSDLTVSGATTGQVPKWNGSAWVPAADSTGSASGAVTAANLTALTGMTGASGTVVLVANAFGTDGIQSQYAWASAVPSWFTGTNALCIAGSSAGHYWVRDNAAGVPVEVFGALGNDSTDNGTALGRAWIATQQARAEAVLGAGVYRTSTEWSATSHGVSGVFRNLQITGQGTNYSTLRSTSGSDVAIFNVNGASLSSGFALRRLKLVGGATVEGINWQGGCRDAVLEDVEIRCGKGGTRAQNVGCHGVRYERVTIADVTDNDRDGVNWECRAANQLHANLRMIDVAIHNVTGSGFVFERCTNWHVLRARITDWGTDSTVSNQPHGVYASETNRVFSIRDSYIMGTSYSLDKAAAIQTYSHFPSGTYTNVSIMDGIISGNILGGAHGGAFLYSVANVVFENNLITNLLAAATVGIGVGDGVDGLEIRNNRIYGYTPTVAAVGIKYGHGSKKETGIRVRGNLIEGFNAEAIGYGASGWHEAVGNTVVLTVSPLVDDTYAIGPNPTGGGVVGKGLIQGNRVIDLTSAGNTWGGISTGTRASQMLRDNTADNIRGPYSFKVNGASHALNNVSLNGAGNDFSGASTSVGNLDLSD